MLTLNEAKNLQRGDILIDRQNKRWKVNGMVKLWKRDASRIRIPLKHGLYSYDAITGADFDREGNCELLTKEA